MIGFKTEDYLINNWLANEPTVYNETFRNDWMMSR